MECFTTERITTMSNYEWNSEDALSEELTDAELAEIQGGHNYNIYLPSVTVNNQVLVQVAALTGGNVYQFGLQDAH
jgi:bacteriocin-like protein